MPQATCATDFVPGMAIVYTHNYSYSDTLYRGIVLAVGITRRPEAECWITILEADGNHLTLSGYFEIEKCIPTCYNTEEVVE